MEEERCANCGRIYSEHEVGTTFCYPGQPGRWFPESIAEAIIKFRSKLPKEARC